MAKAALVLSIIGFILSFLTLGYMIPIFVISLLPLLASITPILALFSVSSSVLSVVFGTISSKENDWDKTLIEYKMAIVGKSFGITGLVLEGGTLITWILFIVFLALN